MGDIIKTLGELLVCGWLGTGLFVLAFVILCYACDAREAHR